jgi:hypothetical protein
VFSKNHQESHERDYDNRTVLREAIRRGQVLGFFSCNPRCVVGLEACATAHYWARARHQFIITQPVVIFFSAAYFAAASLTMGAITESSAVIQSDAIFHFLPSQVWMRPVRVPS